MELIIKNEDKDNVSEYIANVYSKSEKYINCKIWDGIDIISFRNWKANFKTLEELYFSALVLDNLTYRTDSQVDSMLFDLFTMSLPNILRQKKDPLYPKIRNSWKIFISDDSLPVKIVNTNTKTTQSSGLLVNRLNHQCQFRTKYFTDLGDVKMWYDNGIRYFILIDDIICSGEQIRGILDGLQLENLQEIKIYICVCAAHDIGIQYIKNKYPNIEIAYAEHLTCKNSFLDSVDYIFPIKLDKNTLDEFYKDFLLSRGFVGKYPYGRTGMGLDYAFHESVPNETIAILHLYNDKINKLLNKRGA